MIFKKYNECVFCKSKRLKKENKQNLKRNFYINAIMNDLKISENKLKAFKVYRCLNCKIIQNNPWFTEEVSRKIYSNIYGQHNRGWSNLINFIKNGKTPNHGVLYDLLYEKINIKKYAEFNSPFMGLMLNFFQSEYWYSKSLLNYREYLLDLSHLKIFLILHQKH